MASKKPSASAREKQTEADDDHEAHEQLQMVTDVASQNLELLDEVKLLKGENERLKGENERLQRGNEQLEKDVDHWINEIFKMRAVKGRMLDNHMKIVHVDELTVLHFIRDAWDLKIGAAVTPACVGSNPASGEGGAPTAMESD